MGRDRRTPLRSSANEVKFKGDPAASLSKVVAQVEQNSAGAQATFRFQSGAASNAQLPGLRVTRLNKSGGDDVRIELQSSTSPLPCAVVAPFWPAAKRLGSASCFQGIA